MAFPSNPYNGEIYTSSMGLQYIYDSTDGKWNVNGSPISFTGTQGLTGAQGYTGAQGVTGIKGTNGTTGAQGATGMHQIIVRNGETLNFTANAKNGEWLTDSSLGDHRMRLPFTIIDWHITSRPAGAANVWVKLSSWYNYSQYTAMHWGSATGPKALPSFPVQFGWAHTGIGKWDRATGMDGDILTVDMSGVTGIQSISLSMHTIDEPQWATGIIYYP
jgi:hypothetical protein